MSKLKDLVSKGVRLIVVDEGAGSTPSPAPTTLDPDDLLGIPKVPTPPPLPGRGAAPPRPSAPPVAPSAPAARSTSAVPSNVEDFKAVYDEAGISLPAHGYGIDKVAEMLSSKRLQAMAPEVKAAAVMAALEAAGVSLRDVIKDAVSRDQALDAFEGAKEREAAELRARNEARLSEVQEEIDAYLKKKNAEVESLKKESAAAAEALTVLREKKQREEQRLHDLVAHFVEGGENPVTTGPARSTPPTPPPPPAKPSR
jgi:hypothetical protein